jgi:hypothetical protein
MSDTDSDSDSDSISDSSNAHVDDAGGDEALISSDVREFCNELRANDPRFAANGSVFELSDYIYGCSEAEGIAVFQALKENTSVKHIDFKQFQRRNTERSALVAAEYVESSKTLQTLNLSVGFNMTSQMLSLVLRALSRNTSVTELIMYDDVVRFASVAFQELLTCTQTLQNLHISGSVSGYDEVQIAAITSDFANNTTLRDLVFTSWREADLTPVLAALQDHPALQKIHFSAKYLDYLPSLSGLEVLLRSHESQEIGS